MFLMKARLLYVCPLSLREMAIIREVNETVFALSLLETGGMVGSESRERVIYSILSAHLAPPTLRRLHLVISDCRPPSVSESGEAALRRQLASRAIGGYALTSGDPAPGSPTMFQSGRVARPQDASKAPYFRSLLCSSARPHLDVSERPVSEVAHMETGLVC